MTGPRRPLRGITPQASPAVLEARYERVAGRTPPGDDVDAMEAALGVDLPDDARAIIRFYRGGMLGGISHLTWATTGSYSVVERTAALRRALDLPAIFVVLAEPVEAAIVWRRDRPSVVWCHAHDIERVVRGEPPTSDVTSWDTYAGFFEYMLNAEEEEQSE